MVGLRRSALRAALLAAAWTALPPSIPSPAAQETFRFRIDPAGSHVRFEGETTLHDLKGEARRFHGEGRAPKSLYGPGASARVVIEAASISTENFLRDAVMRKSTLEIEKFPEVIFQVDGLASEGGPPPPPGPMRLILSGRLSLHGVTKEKRFPVVVERREEGFVVSGKFSLSLSEHRIPDPSLFFNKVRDEVAAEFRFTAIRVPENP